MPTFQLMFRPGVSADVQIDNGNLLFYASPRKVAQIPDQTRVIEDALENPIGSGKQVINRDYREGPFVNLDRTGNGTPIEVNEDILKADFKMAVGTVVPHISAGWGGGSKIILPGVCSQKTTDMMHLVACVVQPVLEVIGDRDNKPRAAMDAIAQKVGLDFIVNTYGRSRRRPAGIYGSAFPGRIWR